MIRKTNRRSAVGPAVFGLRARDNPNSDVLGHGVQVVERETQFRKREIER